MHRLSVLAVQDVCSEAYHTSSTHLQTVARDTDFFINNGNEYSLSTELLIGT